MKSTYPEQLFGKMLHAVESQPKDSIQRVACESTASLLLTLIYRADRLRKLLHVTLALLGAEIILLAALAILICIQ